MILIIRNIKSNDLLLLAFVCVFYKRKDKAAIRSIIFCCDILHPTIDQRLLLYPTSCSHLEVDLLPHFIIFWIVGTSLCQNTKHIKNTTAVTIFRLHYLTIPVSPLLIDKS